VSEEARLVLSSVDRARVDDVARLSQSGRASVAALVSLLGEPSWVVRRAVVAALARVGTPAVEPLCAVLAEDRTSEARLAAAVDALVASSGDVDPAILSLAARTQDNALVCDVAQILGRRKSQNAIPFLTEWCRHADDNIAVAAIEALGRVGGNAATTALISAVESGNFFRVFPAISVLGRTGDARAVAPLTARLAEVHYVAEAAAALGRTGQIAAAVPLTKLLAGDADTIRTAARGLLDLHRRYFERTGDPEAVPRAVLSSIGRKAATSLEGALEGGTVEDTVALASVLGWMHDTAGVMALVGLLDGEESAAQEAFRALRGIAEDAEPLVRDAVRTGDSARRLRLLPLLGARRSVVGELITCLRDPEPAVRAAACDALGRIGDASAVGALFGLLGDTDARVAQAALGAVQSLGSEEVKNSAFTAARSEEPRARRAALRIIAYFAYPDGLEILLEAISDPDERIRDAAASGLAWLEDPRAAGALLTAASHPSPHTRAATLRSMASSIPTPEVIVALGRGLADPDAWVRYYACQSIGKLRVGAATAKISQMVDDEAGQVRVAAVEAVARLGGAQALLVLESASRSADLDVRRAALLGLGELRRPGALPILLRAAESEDATTRLAALSAIAASQTPEAMNALSRAASDADPRVRDAVFALLAARTGVHATYWIIEQLSREEDRERALRALASPVEGRIEAILTSLEGADAMLAGLLADALLRMRRADSNAAVEAMLQLDNVAARRAGARALLELGTASARKVLVEAAIVDSDDEVRRIAAAAL
jgi:HEAT repeat protein